MYFSTIFLSSGSDSFVDAILDVITPDWVKYVFWINWI